MQHCSRSLTPAQVQLVSILSHCLDDVSDGGSGDVNSCNGGINNSHNSCHILVPARHTPNHGALAV